MTIDLVISTNDRFAPHSGVMLASLFENNPQTHFTVHVLYIRLSDESRSRLTELAAAYGAVLRFYRIDAETWEGLPHSKNFIEVEAYNRLLIPNLLDPSISRVLYLDGDMVVTGSVRALWETNLDDCAAAVVAEPDFDWQQSIFCRMHYPETASYFNSGMLLLNLAYMREHGMQERIATVLNEHGDCIVYHDQDVLNIVFHDAKKLVSDKWNYIGGRTARAGKREGRSERELPVIVHFIGPIKPWHWGCRHIYTRLYRRYRQYTPWRESRITLAKSLDDVFHPAFYIAYLLRLTPLYTVAARLIKRGLVCLKRGR